MNKVKTKIIRNIIIYISLLIGITFLLKDNIFFKNFNYLIIVLYIAFCINIMYYFLYRLFNNFNKYRFITFLVSYVVIIFLTLYYRKTNNTFKLANPMYIKDWIKMIFTSKIVFLNIVGNIILFIPFGFLLSEIKNINNIIKFIISLIIIIILEFIQYITKKGVFDYIDIILNYIGIIIGFSLHIGKEH